MNNFNCFLSESLNVALFFAASGLLFLKDIADYVSIFSAFNRLP